jgi:hypothetical protein
MNVDPFGYSYLDIPHIAKIQGSDWFCPRCGRGVLITTRPVPGLLLEREGAVHKHEARPFLAGYLEQDPLGTGRAEQFAHEIDAARMKEQD